MANTVRAAKNTFGGGLVMDLAPDTTPNEVLTSALNATLVTFNGNEMLLQNDMGNGRVETARLPEGYIPVGTCEFGDIIYIVSYNPLTNKSQIGCFPSPERNISSEETGGANQILSASDFLVMNGDTPTGELKANSVKKIIYNNKLNPGDKFVIYDTSNQILSEEHITDIGNISHVYGAFPKWLRIHVIAIEDGGKINYLDSTLKWYSSYSGVTANDYFIRPSATALDGSKKPDIDSYRNLLNSGYSVYQSKISGKLALLIELEKINGFSCTYTVYGKDVEVANPTAEHTEYRQYYVYWNFNWNTDDPNINPSMVVLTESEWTGKEENRGGTYYQWALHNGLYRLDASTGINVGAPPSENWHADITSNINTDNYSNFINGDYPNNPNIGSYLVMLNKFLNSMIATYGNVALTKLNIYRKNDEGYKQLPQPGEYYVNAAKLEYGESGYTVYTQKNSNGQYTPISQQDITDDIVNNYFNYPVYKPFSQFTIPIKQIFHETVDNKTVNKELKPDTLNLIYHYEVTPAMPYGLLREYSINGYIDFSKIGTGAIDLKTWKYFNGENVSTLTIGMDAYVEDNMGIQSVVLEFYDNQGLAAAYHITDKVSYSGQFTEMIPLNGSTTTYKLLNIDSAGNKHLHLGPEAHEGDTNLVRYNEQTQEIEKTTWVNDGTCHIDDCGTLYFNMLYLVKIVVKYCPVNALGEFDTSDAGNYKHFYRWMWTNTMFNLYYHTVTDFNDIQLELTLNVFPTYELTDSYYFGQFEYESPNDESLVNSEDIYKYLSSNVQVVTDVESAQNADLPDDGGETPGGGDTPQPEPELTQEVTNGLNVFTITFNKSITNINFGAITFRYNGTTLAKDTGYIVSSGVGNSVFVVAFPNAGNTYSMYINIPSGAIVLGDYKNNTINFTYSYRDGEPVT